MIKSLKLISIIALLSFLPTVLVWLPFYLQVEDVMGIPIAAGGMQTVISNYDGPLYLVIAKSLYNLDFIAANYSFPLPAEYWAAHFPMFPLIVKLIGYFTTLPWGMIITTSLSAVLASFYFFKLALGKLNRNQALWLTFVFSIFPARWLIVKSIGSPEPMFLASILGSVYYFKERKYWKSGLWGVVAQLTKSPGILLFVALALAFVFKNLSTLVSTKKGIRRWLSSLDFKAYPIFLIPISLLLLFGVYRIQFGNFFAYFNSGDNIHLFFPPFQIFNYTQPWVGTFWLEEIIFIYAISALGITRLFKQKLITEAIFSLVFFVTIIFVSHRDVLRYSLPIMPFMLLSFGKALQSNEVRFVVLFLLLPIYLFALAFISANIMPIADWTALL